MIKMRLKILLILSASAVFCQPGIGPQPVDFRGFCENNAYPMIDYKQENGRWQQNVKECSKDTDCAYGANQPSNYRCVKNDKKNKNYCCPISCPLSSYMEYGKIGAANSSENAAPALLIQSTYGPVKCDPANKDETKCHEESICYQGKGFKEAFCCRGPFYCSTEANCTQTLGDTFTCSSGQCILKCKEGEFHHGQRCLKIAKVGEACENSMQCRTAYTACVEKTCKCLGSMEAKDGKCVSKDPPQCVFGGEPEKNEKGEAKNCSKKPYNSTFEYGLPTAVGIGQPASGFNGNFANGTAGNNGVKMQRKANEANCGDKYACIAGLCCPAPKSVCAAGEAVFMQDIPYDQTNGNKARLGKRKKRQYPYHGCPENYEAKSISFNAEFIQFCCPRACPSYEFIEVNGQCYKRAQINEPCEIDAQCDTGAIYTTSQMKPLKKQCKANADGKKVCSCPDGLKYRPAFTGANHGSCVDETQIGNNICPDGVVAFGTCREGSNCPVGFACMNGMCCSATNPDGSFIRP